jgi:hypothetical protein
MVGNYGFVKKLNAAAIVVLVLCAALNVAAQESAFKDEDLKALIKNAAEKLDGKTYRLKTTSVNYRNGNSTPAFTEKTISEFIPPERERIITETQTPEGVKRYESIRIGEKRFIRYDNGEWQEMGGTGMGSGNGSGGGTSAKVETTIERRFRKGEIINNQTADFYETVTTTKFIYPEKTYTTVWKTANWFDVNGLFVKSENEYQSDHYTKTIFRTTREYEYDANIKIEAPLIDSKQKVKDKP